MVDTLEELHDPIFIRKMGIQALTKELGPVGMAYFIRQFDRGDGDYTKEKDAIFAGMSSEEIDKELEEFEKNGGNK